MKKLLNIKLLPCLILIVVVCLNVGYSAFSAKLTIDVLSAVVRTSADIRVTNFSIEPSSDGVVSSYEEYNVDSISNEVELPNSDSWIKYKITITNFEAPIMGIFGVTGLPDNLTYEFTNYSMTSAICDDNNNCNLGISKDIYVIVKYKENGYHSDDTVYKFDMFFEFREILSVTHPVLDNTGMVPVVINDNGSVYTVSEYDSTWYDYDDKKWANAVLVKSDGSQTRSYYLNNPGVEVNSSDILAYYVWIPRFSYKIWSGITAIESAPQEIEIRFDDVDTISNGSAIGQWLTHPAFWWNANNNSTRDVGEEISGFWVGKFETSKGTSSDVGTSSPIILPNKSSWVSQNVVTQFQTMLKFSGGTFNTSSGAVTFSGSSTYGLASTTDSHMMKNSEWGAVAYLSHSIYGKKGEIRINNYYSNSKFLTGCGASADNAASSTSCSIKYADATSYPQSTTGNISGVFDMSGGAWDRLMGNYNNTKGSSSFSSFPVVKYYDLFKISGISYCTYLLCGGQALSEVFDWYSDLDNYPNTNYPWFVRGGGYNDKAETGAFNLGRNIGSSSTLSTTRSTLIVSE